MVLSVTLTTRWDPTGSWPETAMCLLVTKKKNGLKSLSIKESLAHGALAV